MYRALNAGYECASLFTMIDETGKHSRSHGLFPEALRAQAQSLGIPLRTAPASWGAYEKHFREQAIRFRREQILHGVFGDIDLEPHRAWVERVCGEAGITAHLPLWKGERRALIREFVEAGFKAMIVVVNRQQLSPEFLGRVFDMPLIDELENAGVDACGENGEFHTFVFDGPLFKKQLAVVPETIVENDGYSFLPLTVT